MSQCQGDVIPVEEVSNNRNWINWIKNLQDPRMSRLNCYPCSMTRQYNQMRDNEYSDMASEHGILYSSKHENAKAIRRHAASKGHERVQETIKKFQLGEVIGSLADLIAKKGTNPYNEATNNVMIAVNYEISVHNSLNSHPVTMDMLKGFGVDVGNPHCHSSRAARDFVIAQSETYHEKFIGDLTEDIPLTLSMLITKRFFEVLMNLKSIALELIDFAIIFSRYCNINLDIKIH